ncbi:MAG: Phenylalanine-tRNA ligase alpha subunit [Microgenomates group bacterium GW2011_GWF2_45_18]|nr:MAG: Phenylalanine-tRNA ligase alpha subunit [Microgenomates group bacterium GW2011_GWF1_44_10]KKU01741.1 MAG: Phenylalanine-tRNA ligase alpha subunit [Microgenomates group bacterium GW2011_GWF2_45_18]HAU98958.1 phenylalanine--tRNA ligase subunit alpha [Candidatus Paceibacterota bacterium]
MDNAQQTQTLYLNDAFQKTASATVLDIKTEGNTTHLFLDKTLFYPQGGGQASDKGAIRGSQGTFLVSHVSFNGGLIRHTGKLEGIVTVGEIVQLELDWEWRYLQMQQHTAGHLVDIAVKRILPDAIAINGEHGIKKECSVEYSTEIQPEMLEKVQAETNKVILENLPITFEFTTKEELEKKGLSFPYQLPSNKQLRIMYVGGQFPLPDGGTQLLSTGESWNIRIKSIEKRNNSSFIVYAVEKPAQKIETSKKVEQSAKNITLEAFQQSADIILEKSKTFTSDEIVDKILSKKGDLAGLMQMLPQVETDQKKIAGKIANELKKSLLVLVKKASVAHTLDLDLTAPLSAQKKGHVHPISSAMNEITRIFERIGFMHVRYPEVDWEWYPFDSLNMPKDHPARDEWETFLVDSPYYHPQLGKMVLTPHTSNGQVREMQRLESKPPIRMINIARCYRRQADVTHTEMFHQFEGLVVDKGITIQHLKGTIDHFAREFYGPGARSRIRPFHFMFTEPSFEVDFSCTLCDGTGFIKGERCRFCKSGWHEVGGAGMVHPNVLKAGGINPNEYTGFAFGWGIERTYTLRKGLKLDDIRLLYSGNVSFLKQF